MAIDSSHRKYKSKSPILIAVTLTVVFFEDGGGSDSYSESSESLCCSFATAVLVCFRLRSFDEADATDSSPIKENGLIKKRLQLNNQWPDCDMVRERCEWSCEWIVLAITLHIIYKGNTKGTPTTSKKSAFLTQIPCFFIHVYVWVYGSLMWVHTSYTYPGAKAQPRPRHFDGTEVDRKMPLDW